MTDDMIIGLSSRGRIVFINRAASMLLGSPSVAEGNQRLSDLVSLRQSDDGADQTAELLAERSFTARRLLMRTRDGRELHVAASLAGTARAGGRVLSLHDVTGRVTYAESLADANERLAAQNRELDDFAYVTSHDLQTPLRGIEHLLAWLGEELAESDN